MRCTSPILGVLLTGMLAGCGPEERAELALPGAEPVASWNRLLMEVAEQEDGFLTLKGVRTAAMMHLAMHDALTAIDSRYRAWSPGGSADRTTKVDPLAIASQAAWKVATTQYPDQSERFDAERERWTPDAAALEAARELADAAAARVLEGRESDGWDTEAEYAFHPMAPGVYAEFEEHSGTPKGFVFGAGWARARPFVLPSPDHVRVAPPPEISSPEYTAAFDEVKEVGARTSTTRTDDQAHLAMWWKDFAESSHNRLARRLAVEAELDLVESARLFALLNVAVFDAYVGVFDNKFHFNHWRPYTAIRWAEHDDNPDTVADPDWTNLHDHTYAFPSYPSAHGTACTAAMTVLEDTLGDGLAFEMSTPEVDVAGPFSGKVAMDPPTRSFSSFSEAAMECSLSRVYLGIHFRYDSLAGVELGRRIGEEILGRALTSRDS